MTPNPQTNKTIDELKYDIAIEVGIVHKHSKLGADYTVNCTDTILSMCESYSEALITEAERKARSKALSDMTVWANMEMAAQLKENK